MRGTCGVILTISGELPDTPLTPCEEDIIRVLTDAGKKLTRKEVARAFIVEETLWAESTLANALASLVARGILQNRHDRKGYGLAKPVHRG